MATSHFEKIRFLTLEQVDEVFELSLDSLHQFRDANDMLSPDIVKAIVENHLWFLLKELFDAENPTMRALETVPPWAAPESSAPAKKPRKRAAGKV
ncbi:MAG: hypothetical protein JNM32_01465 [Dechloromonas sp.]|nr:hypothetical protein [Dechloromonas sp.]